MIAALWLTVCASIFTERQELRNDDRETEIEWGQKDNNGRRNSLWRPLMIMTGQSGPLVSARSKAIDKNEKKYYKKTSFVRPKMEAKIPALLPSADGAAPCGTSSMASAPVIKIIMLDRKESFANDYDAVVCLLLRWGPSVIVIRLLWSSLMCNWPENCFSSPLFSHTKHTTAAGIFLFFFFF